LSAKQKYSGFAIAIAWPETYCKQPGSWYDPLTLWMGINTNNYYRVGHAAVVLIDTENLKCHYFDFGRYHAPFQHGRVRSEETDHELSMKTIPAFSPDNTALLNYREILSELQNNKACHGEGNLHASYCPVNFQAAYHKATQMQQVSPIPYGPFRLRGSNCSRFVNTVIRAGKPLWKFRFRLKFLVWFTPTPMNNVNSLEHSLFLPDQLNGTLFYPTKKLENKTLQSTLQPPSRDAKIPENAQWLSGEGAGSWFTLVPENSQLKVTRYAPDGQVECTGFYKNPGSPANISHRHFLITYPSNCKFVSLKNQDEVLRFERV
jgi:hypothetical protein